MLLALWSLGLTGNHCCCELVVSWPMPLFHLLCLVTVALPIGGWCCGHQVGGGVTVSAAWDVLVR